MPSKPHILVIFCLVAYLNIGSPAHGENFSMPYTYFIYNDSGIIRAINGSTLNADYSGTSFSGVANKALKAMDSGKIVFKNPMFLDYPGIRIVNKKNLIIESDGNEWYGNKGLYNGIVIISSYNITVKNIKLRQIGYFSLIVKNSSTIRLDNIDISDGGESGIHTNNVTDISITRSYSKNNWNTTLGGDGYDILDTRGLLISDSIAEGGDSGFAFYGVEDANIVNTIANGTSRYAYKVTDWYVPRLGEKRGSKNITFTNALAKNTVLTDGFAVRQTGINPELPSKRHENVKFIGVTSVNNAGNGFDLSAVDSVTVIGATAQYNAKKGLYAADSTDVNIFVGNYSNNALDGLAIERSQDLKLNGITSSQNRRGGISIRSVDGAEVIGDTAKYNERGILAADSSGVNIIGGSYINNTLEGVDLVRSQDSKVIGVTSSLNQFGIRVYGTNQSPSFNTIISDNIVFGGDVQQYGIYSGIYAFRSIINNNIVLNNTIRNIKVTEANSSYAQNYGVSPYYWGGCSKVSRIKPFGIGDTCRNTTTGYMNLYGIGGIWRYENGTAV